MDKPLIGQILHPSSHLRTNGHLKKDRVKQERQTVAEREVKLKDWRQNGLMIYFHNSSQITGSKVLQISWLTFVLILIGCVFSFSSLVFDILKNCLRSPWTKKKKKERWDIHYIIRICHLCRSVAPFYLLCITLNCMWIWYSDNNKQVLMPVLNMIRSGHPPLELDTLAPSLEISKMQVQVSNSNTVKMLSSLETVSGEEFLANTYSRKTLTDIMWEMSETWIICSSKAKKKKKSF